MAQKTIIVPEQRVFIVLVSLLFLSWRDPWTKALDKIDTDSPEVTCSEGLHDCEVTSESLYGAMLSEHEGSVNVTHLDLNAVLCCTNSELCVACLQVTIGLTEVHELEESGDGTQESLASQQTTSGSGQVILEESLVNICFSSPGSGDFCKTVHFTFSSSNATVAHELSLRETVMFGSLILVRVLGQSGERKQHITIPSLETTCSIYPEDNKIKDCDVPSLQFEPDHESDVVRLILKNNDTQKLLMCQMVWDETVGEILPMAKGRNEIAISMRSIAPCLCFQVWWKDNKLRRKYCPFQNQQTALERMQNNISLALTESPMRRGNSALIWNVSAPCRLKAEVWLCKRDVVGGGCQEILGSRLKVDEHVAWVTTLKESWKTGEFIMPSHPLLCLQIKLDGTQKPLDPYCPFAVSRWRWIVILLVALLLLACVSIFGACCFHQVLKGYAWRWMKDADVRGAVGGAHVVLLYPPDDEQALPGLMCHLGSSLQALGCSVSLDLWSHAELSALGPVPWLHSRLDQLQKQGGKVILVLTQAARKRAEEWGARSWERFTPYHKDIDNGTHLKCVDVFSASLSCILADYLQGRAGERFMLVQFESLPPEEVCQRLPELFRGLHVYSLPSQSLGFLTELAGARTMATSSSRRKRAHGLRLASRSLARGLSGFTAGTAVLRLAAMPKSCVGPEEEDFTETMPLQPFCQTPPSSPDTNPKISPMEWV